MSETKGYDEKSHRRIEAMVRKSERLNLSADAPTTHDPVSRLRRVILDGKLLIDAPTTGRERIQGPDGIWLTTSQTVPQIYLGTPETALLEAQDEVWIAPMSGKWFSVAAAAAGRDVDPASKTCCGPCIDQVFMSIDGLYAKKYVVKQLPIALGGPEVRLAFVGALSEFPSQLTSTVYGWESDSFEYTTDLGTDLYIWRMAAEIDISTGQGVGLDSVLLYLVNVGSTTHNPDLSLPACIDGAITDIFCQYANIPDWRARCGSTLNLRFPQWQQPELDALLPCSVCVSPSETIDYEDLDTCWQSILDTMCRTELPGTLYVRMESGIGEKDADDIRRVRKAAVSMKLHFDISVMKYVPARSITAPDCAGSSPSPTGFHQVGSVVGGSDLGGASPEFPDPHLYFELSCVDATTIRVTHFAREEWEVSTDGVSRSCAVATDLTVSTQLYGVFETYLHAVRISPAVDLLSAWYEWSLSV